MEVATVTVPPDSLLEHSVRVAGAELYWVRSTPFEVRCQPARAEGTLKLLAAVEGSLELRQDERRAVLRPGMFTWVDADGSFELVAEGGRHLQLRLPAEMIRRRHSELDLRTAVARGSAHPGERILRELLRQMAIEGRSLSRSECAAAVSTLVEAVGMGARRRIETLAERRVVRAQRDVDAHLGEVELDASAVARRQGVSRRYLDSLFRAGIGVSLSDYIRQRRLERAARDLIASPDDLTSEIGQRHGFRDASHFSRVFRKFFQQSPSAYRIARAARR